MYANIDDDDVILSSILNVDFSQVALQISKDQAHQLGLRGMQYLKIDLRQWKDIACNHHLINEGLINIILDKSTSDAISTNVDISLDDFNQASICPLLQKSQIVAKSIDPLDFVATHLAALSKAGCIWVVLSYSTSRFDFLTSEACLSRRYWTVVKKQPVKVPQSSKDPHAPPIYHYFYQLQRSTNT